VATVWVQPVDTPQCDHLPSKAAVLTDVPLGLSAETDTPVRGHCGTSEAKLHPPRNAGSITYRFPSAASQQASNSLSTLRVLGANPIFAITNPERTNCKPTNSVSPLVGNCNGTCRISQNTGATRPSLPPRWGHCQLNMVGIVDHFGVMNLQGRCPPQALAVAVQLRIVSYQRFFTSGVERINRPSHRPEEPPVRKSHLGRQSPAEPRRTLTAGRCF